jgi:hypothetical protein
LELGNRPQISGSPVAVEAVPATGQEPASACIYPGPYGPMSPEHYLPMALGTFEGYKPLQDRVCRFRNERIGDSTELRFLGAGPIAFFR